MPADSPVRSNGNGSAGYGFPLSGLTAELLGPAPSEATAVIYTQMAHAVGLAMQNIVSQQQTLNTINNAIATKALNLLADKDPATALEQIRAQFDSTTNNTVSALTQLATLARGAPAGGNTAPEPAPSPPPHAEHDSNE
jgi:Killing trait